MGIADLSKAPQEVKDVAMDLIANRAIDMLAEILQGLWLRANDIGTVVQKMGEQHNAVMNALRTKKETA